MKLIAHRGNITGARPELENRPDYIDSALRQGYDVEIDLRTKNKDLYLGHDHAEYEISYDYLLERKKRLWVHCKDPSAFDIALHFSLNCFWHQTDDYTLTSNGYVWAYPGKIEIQNNKTILVMPETIWNANEISNFQVYGICSDLVGIIKEKL